jgi:hypothetical protein
MEKENAESSANIEDRKPKKSSAMTLLIAGAVVLVIGFLMLQLSRNNPESVGVEEKYKVADEGQQSNKYKTKSDDQASVTIDVTPIELGASNEVNNFDIIINTHTVALDYDFADIITLEDDMGNKYKSIKWDGGSGSHHINGEISFPELESEVKSVKMTIDGVAGVKRYFDWEL